MSFFYGSLAVIGWAWTALVVAALAADWYVRRRARPRGFEVIESDANKH
jgi:hypothetical protein